MSSEFRTVRDLFRYAVSEFRRAKLSFGHGAASAADEAAFLILEGLKLPIDAIDPFLKRRLTAEERTRLSALIEARIATRKPAAYLLNRAYIQGVPFHVDERAIVPRSYIGELLADGSPAVFPHTEEVRRVLDLCTGSGCLAVLAALAYPEAEVDATDLSKGALEVARRNVADHGLGDRVRLYEGDLFAPLGGKTYDLILANPPYVSAAAMAALPEEYRAEPPLALAGGEDGLDIVRRILDAAPAHLTARGVLLCEIGTGQEVLERDYPDFPFLWLDTEASEGEVFKLDAGDWGR